MSNETPSKTVRFYRDRQTTGTWLYREEPEPGDTSVARSIYFNKPLLAEWDDPDVIVVTFQPGD